MSASLERRLLQLAAELCANHQRRANGIADYCLLEWTDGHRCVFAIGEGSRCRYFEEGVLPLNPELQAVYMHDRTARAAGDTVKPEMTRRVATAVRSQTERACPKCGQAFTPASNRQRYCEPCRKAVRKEQIRERVRSLRATAQKQGCM